MNDHDIKRWRSYARQCALCMGLRGDDIEDATQQALIALLAAWGTGNDPHALYSTVVRREVSDWRDYNKRREIIRIVEGVDDDAEDDGDTPLRHSDSGQYTYDPHEIIDALSALNDLPIRQRMAIEMQAEGYAPAEIAEAIGAVDVRSVRKRARRNLRATLNGT